MQLLLTQCAPADDDDNSDKGDNKDDDGIDDDDDDDDDEGGGCGDDNTSLLGTGIGALSKYLKLKGRFSETRWKETLFLPHILALFGTDVHYEYSGQRLRRYLVLKIDNFLSLQ